MRLSLLAALLFIVGCAPRPGTAPEPAAVPGFDLWQYPGAERMATFAAEAPYRWVGYYLASPCRRDASWTGRRAEIEGLGLGLAALYVGQQTFDEATTQPDLDGIAAGTVNCSRALLTAERGRQDGADAVTQMAREGFPEGSIVYLNVERMERTPWAMTNYLRAWFGEVLRDGRFTPGAYVHVRNASELFGHARLAFEAADRRDLPPFWVAGGSGFTLDALPTDSGLPFASAWQGALDVERTFGGITLTIDENVATRANPSAPRPASR